MNCSRCIEVNILSWLRRSDQPSLDFIPDVCSNISFIKGLLLPFSSWIGGILFDSTNQRDASCCDDLHMLILDWKIELKLCMNFNLVFASRFNWYWYECEFGSWVFHVEKTEQFFCAELIHICHHALLLPHYCRGKDSRSVRALLLLHPVKRLLGGRMEMCAWTSLMKWR